MNKYRVLGNYLYVTHQFAYINLIYNARISITMILASIRFFIFTPLTSLIDIGHLYHDTNIVSIEYLNKWTKIDAINQFISFWIPTICRDHGCKWLDNLVRIFVYAAAHVLHTQDNNITSPINNHEIWLLNLQYGTLSYECEQTWNFISKLLHKILIKIHRVSTSSS